MNVGLISSKVQFRLFEPKVVSFEFIGENGFKSVHVIVSMNFSNMISL